MEIPHSFPSCRLLPALLRWGLGLFACGGSVGLAQELVFPVREYRVSGAKQLQRLQVEEAVYPYLGPGRTAADVEAARAALEKAYRDNGFQTVSVGIPQQDPRSGIIRLEVVEGTVGRLRVTGAKWFLPSAIKRGVPSLAEGSVPDMNRATAEMLALNRLADRRVTPELRPGLMPGTVDIDLKVEDKLPLHGSLELNNRYSANTSPLRLNASLSYGNVFQLGHTLGLSGQVAPENPDDALVYSGYYLARMSSGVSLMVMGTRQDSDVSTLGGAAVAGRGGILGVRAIWDLPVTAGFYQTLSLGMDYKNFDENLTVGDEVIASPISYYPVSATYGASWLAEKSFTELNVSLNLHLRGLGSGEQDYSNKRFGADGSYMFLRADAAHTRDLKGGSQLFGKLQGQLSSQPLINGEQMSGGGLGNARGYLEATALGDNGLFGTFEGRGPSWIGTEDANGHRSAEWRLHAFADAGVLVIQDALPSQRRSYGFASAGFGTRLKLADHFNGSLDVAMPFLRQADADPGAVRVTFRGWAEF